MKPSREERLYNALKRITQYDSPEKLRRRAERDYGMSPEEVIEMAYDNVLIEARSALRGIRPPRIPKAPTP